MAHHFLFLMVINLEIILKKFLKAFKENYPNVCIGYSYKTVIHHNFVA